MKRRNVLAGAGLALSAPLVGCTEFQSNSNTSTPEPDIREGVFVDEPTYEGTREDSIHTSHDLPHINNSTINITSIEDGCAQVEWSGSTAWVLLSHKFEPIEAASNLHEHDVPAAIVRDGDSVHIESEDGNECTITLSEGEVNRYESIEEVERTEENACSPIASGYPILRAENGLVIAEAAGAVQVNHTEWCHEDVVVIDGRVFEVRVSDTTVQLVEGPLDRLVKTREEEPEEVQEALPEYEDEAATKDDVLAWIVYHRAFSNAGDFSI